MNNKNQTNYHKCYLDNLEYFKNNQPLIYQQLQIFDNIINQKQYNEKFSLIYEDNSFNILNIQSNKKLYSINSLSYSEHLINNISLDDSNTIKAFIHNKSLKNKKYISKLIKYTDINTFQFRQLDNAIFFGSLLAIHIELFIKRFHPKNILIIENEFEIFRSSLFVINYSQLAKQTNLNFSITQNHEIQKENLNTFISSNLIFVNMIKYIEVDKRNSIYIELFEKLFQNKVTLNHSIDNQLLPLKQNIKLLKDKKYNKENKIKFLSINIEIISRVINTLSSYSNKKFNNYETILDNINIIKFSVIKILRDQYGEKVGLNLMLIYSIQTEEYIRTFLLNKTNNKKVNKIFDLWIKPITKIFKKYRKELKIIRKLQNIN